jgi:CheY-like chemotaxis protein
MLAALFEILGHRVDTARDGPEALEMAAAHTYDLIILDIGMPGLTGYEVVSRMRAISHLHAATFVALTGWGAEGDRERARAAGFDRHLTKPAGMEAINSLLAALPA